MRPKSVSILTTVLFSSILAQAWAGSLRVDIQSPKPNQEVGVEAMVTGKVSDPQSRVYVLVRPMKTRDWWVQQTPAPPSHDGSWQVRCSFGTPTEGGGEPYEIIAIASKKRLALKEDQKFEDIPDLGVTSDVVTVKRVP
jgi:hypothetical protein